jgi:hypothetical protein
MDSVHFKSNIKKPRGRELFSSALIRFIMILPKYHGDYFDAVNFGFAWARF